MQTLAVVGHSNTGKTMVATQLAAWFKQQGVRLAVLKHASHGYERDLEGKDSHSYWDTGAEVVAIAGPESFTIHRRTVEDPGLDFICEYLGDCELVLVEGYKHHPGPKIELVRKGVSEQRLKVSGVVAVVTDIPDFKAEEPVFSYDRIEDLAAHLYRTLLKR